MRINEMKELIKKVDEGKQRTLELQDTFQFKCTACGKCCFNNEILMTVYDLVRLRNATKLPTQEIIKRNFINFYLGPSSGLPVLTINFQKFGEGITRCPFLSPAIHIEEVMKRLKKLVKTKKEREELIEKYKKNPVELMRDLKGVKIDRWLCAVHKNRPMICRLFPLGRIKKLDRNMKLKKEIFIIQDKVDWCPGWKEKKKYALKEYLDESEFWHYKEGSDKSHMILEQLLISGCFASTESNKGDKYKPRFQKDSPILRFIGNLIYNFDSFKYFSGDKKVTDTLINQSATHKDFIYILEKVEKITDYFTKIFKKEGITENDVIQFMNKLTMEGGEN